MFATITDSWLWGLPPMLISNVSVPHLEIWKVGITFSSASDFLYYEIFLEMENKEPIVECGIDFFSQYRDYWLKEAASWCYCKKDRIKEVFIRHDTSNGNNSDFGSRLPKDINMQIRLKWDKFEWKALRV